MPNRVGSRLRLIVCLVVSVGIQGCYITHQAYKFNELYNSRVEISKLVSDEKTPNSLRKKLMLVKRIISFAQKEGLNTEGAYRYYIENGTSGVSYIVQAAETNQLKSVTWWFPIVGQVPYLGFFSRQERDLKAKALREQGYDVHVGLAGAFSSLGWFSDPIYSSMLDGEDHELAHTLFHELTHRTFWVPGEVGLNENLAEFTGQILTMKFLSDQNFSKELGAYRDLVADEMLISSWTISLRRNLEDMYQSNKFHRDLALAQKELIFKRYLGPLLPKVKAAKWRAYFDREWNNATVLAVSLYTPNLELFERSFKCSQAKSVGDFLGMLSSKLEDKRDFISALGSFC